MLPRARKRRQAALVASHAGALAVAFACALFTDPEDFVDPRELFFEVLALSQMGLLAIWAVLGRTRWLVWAPTLLLCVCLYWVLWCRGRADAAWAAALVMYVISTLVFVALLHAGGIALSDPDESAAAAVGGLRFTMWNLLAWMTAAAALFGLLRVLRYDRFWMDLRFGVFDSYTLTAFATEVCSYSLLIVLATALLLTEGRLLWRLAVLILLAPLLGAVSWYVWALQGWRDLTHLAAHLTASFLLILISGVSLGVVRSCGYRLTRPL